MSEPQKEISASTVTSNRLFWLSLSEDLSVCSECFFFFFFLANNQISTSKAKIRENVLLQAMSKTHCHGNTVLLAALQCSDGTCRKTKAKEKSNLAEHEASAKRIQSLSWIITSLVWERASRIHAVVFTSFWFGILVFLV